MGLTLEQKSAVFYKENKDLLVSAGAGSGKTKVLSQRVLEYAKIKSNDVRRLLVLTFTDASACDMKKKMKKALIDGGFSDKAELLDSAFICTFDSYALSIVNKYYYLLGLSGNTGLLDAKVEEHKKREIIDEIINEEYTLMNPKFENLLKTFALKDDNTFIKTILELFQKLEIHTDTLAYIDSYKENYMTDNFYQSLIDQYVKDGIEKCKTYIPSYIKCVKMLELDADYFKDYINYYEKFIHDLNFYNDKDHLSKLILEKKPTSPNKNKANQEYIDIFTQAIKAINECNNDLRKILENNFKDNFEKEIELIKKTNEYLLYLFEMYKKFNDKLVEYKKNLNLFSFTDIAKFALKIFENNPSICDEIRNSFDEIMVDEYQDTSSLQVDFIQKISKNNIFMVGDIKQSIYKFRNANPKNFETRYNTYERYDASNIKENNKLGYVIDLTKNFRSREEVVRDIDKIFDVIMTNEYGNADFKNAHQMKFGQEDYNILKNENPLADYNSKVIKYAPLVGDEYSFINKNIQEAFIIGKIIKEIYDRGTFVYDDDLKIFRKVKYSDFAILTEASKASNTNVFSNYKKELTLLGIPSTIEGSVDLKESVFKDIFKNIMISLSTIDNSSPKYRHAISSLARSFIYQETDQAIFDYNVLNKELKILDDVTYLKKFINSSYDDLYFEIISRLEINEKLNLIGNVDEHLAILEAIHSLFISFNDVHYSIDEIVKFFDDLDNDNKYDVNIASSGIDSVRIMTIHKSKGLEFPFVFFPLLDHNFNRKEVEKPIVRSMNYGYAIKEVYEDTNQNGDKIVNIQKAVINQEINREMVSEKLRLLYVALTRTREKMFFICDDEELEVKSPSDYSNFKDMLFNSGFLTDDNNIIKYDLYSSDILNYTNNASEFESKGTKKFEYNKQCIKKEEVTKENISKSLLTLPSKNLKANLDTGTKFHYYLEMMDFKNPNVDEMPIDEKDKYSLKKILALPIIQNIKNSLNVHHEYEFIYTNQSDTYHGIIDLFVEYNDHIDIIDYKLSNIESIEYTHQLSIYKEYLKTLFDLPINTYLLSINKQEVKEVII